MEVLRRLLLIVCSLAAISTLMAPAPVLYQVSQPDFAEELHNNPYPWSHKGQTVAQFQAEQTKDRILMVSAERWEALLRTSRAQAGSYLEADTDELHGIADQIPAGMPWRYLQKSGNQTAQLLEIRRLSPDDYLFGEASFLFRHPYSLWSPLLLVIGILLYIFLPRHRFSEDTLCYGAGFSAVIGPDIIAWMIIVGFFTLGLGVGLSGSPGGISSLFSSKLLAISCILWLFTLFGFYLFRVAARYAGLGLCCSDGHLAYFSPSGTRRVSISDVASVQLGHWQASKWITRFGFLISLVNWRALGPTLLNTSRSDPQLEIYLKNGGTWKFILTGARNVEPVLSCLERQGIQLRKQQNPGESF